MSATVRTLVRCNRCRCSDEMHFNDGCHTAVGFICNCKLTREQVLGVSVNLTDLPNGPLDRKVRAILGIEEERLPTHEAEIIEDEALVAQFLPLGPAKVSRNEFAYPGERF